MRRKFSGQAFGVFKGAAVQIARIGIECGRLTSNRSHNMGVAMANLRNIVVAVEVSMAVG